MAGLLVNVSFDATTIQAKASELMAGNLVRVANARFRGEGSWNQIGNSIISATYILPDVLTLTLNEPTVSQVCVRTCWLELTIVELIGLVFNILNVNLTAAAGFEAQSATSYSDVHSGTLISDREVLMELCPDFVWRLQGDCSNEPARCCLHAK